MGLLDSLRKRAAAPADETESVSSLLQTATADPDAANDAWLNSHFRPESVDESAISEASAAQNPAFGRPSSEPISKSTTETLGGKSEQKAQVESGDVGNVAPSAQNAATHMNEHLAHAGLEPTGVTAFPSENQPELQAASPGLVELPTIESGPIGPEAVIHLATLDLAVGCTWKDVTSAHRDILDSLNSGTAQAWNQRLEVNHAFASLRLLRVGPLKY